MRAALLALCGATKGDMAKAMDITPQTAATYLKRIYGKVGVRSRVELMARVMGTLDLLPDAMALPAPRYNRSVPDEVAEPGTV